MENSTVSKRSIGFGLALAVACILNSLIVVVKEKSDVVMSEMKKITGHHWTTHSGIVILFFLGLGALFASLRAGRGLEMSAGRLTGIVTSAVALSVIIIVGFYLFVD